MSNVRDFGAVGDASVDDTASFERALAALGPAGGTVFVPDGVYLINPIRGIKLTTNVSLRLEPNAVLKAIPVAAGSYAIVRATNVNNVSVQGGTIVGDRAAHPGTTGEWGMGIRIAGCTGVTITSVVIVDCWGDGIYVGANGIGKESKNVAISRCVMRNNRRQGMSLTGCIGVVVDGCEFRDTHGTAPESGIDLEPNAGLYVSDVVIRNCIANGNAGHGMQLCGANVNGVRIESNSCTGNAHDGIYLVRGVSSCQILKNTVEGNGEVGVMLEGSSSNEISSNMVRTNSRQQSGGWSNIRLAEQSNDNLISDNRYGHARLLVVLEKDLSIAADCLGNTMESTADPHSGRR